MMSCQISVDRRWDSFFRIFICWTACLSGRISCFLWFWINAKAADARKFGLTHLLEKYPHELSGGEKQRTAISRALINNPDLILADEPTGNLDEDTAGEIIELLKKTAHELGKSVIVVTHSKLLAEEADKIYEIKNGKLCTE